MHSGPTMHWGHTCQGLLLAACETSRRGLDGQGQRSASHTFQQGSVMYRRCGMWCMGVALAVEPEAGIASLITPIGSTGIFGYFSGVWASVEPEAGVACLSVRPSDLEHLRGRSSTASLGFRTMANSNSLHRRCYCCLSRPRSSCPCGKGWPDIVSYAARLRLCSSPAVQVAQRACVSSGGEATAEKNTYHAKLSSQGISSEDGFQHHSCGPGNRLLDGSVATVG